MSLDMYWHHAASAQAAREAGFRLMNGPVFIDFEEAPDRIPVDQRIERGREFLEEYGDDPLVEPCVCPHTTYTVAPENLKNQYGRTPPRHLDHLGMLSD
jgi:5-methylthioadenosine/S-adenosylhomocysteine deaminase